MNWRFWLVNLLALLAVSAQAATPAPLLRVAPLPSKVLVGQTVEMEISVLVPGWFTAPIELPASFELDGATVRLAEGSSANINERINGQSYAGIRRRYDILPTRAGLLTVPSVSARFIWSNGTRTETHTLTTAPRPLSVTLPPGMEGLDYFIATPNFTLTQSVDQPLQALKVGDAFTRTLTQRASGIPAMQLPALQAVPHDGIALYADEPVLETRQGELGAPDQSLRRERLTYVLQEAGEYELPGVSLMWFDTAAGKLRVARVPALRFTVSPGLQAGIAEAKKTQGQPIAVLPEPTWRKHWQLAVIAALLIGGAVVVARRYVVRWHARYNRICQYFITPERRIFLRALWQLSRSSDPSSQLRAIDAWRVATRRINDTTTAPLERLQRAVYGRSASNSQIISRRAAVALLWQLRQGR